MVWCGPTDPVEALTMSTTARLRQPHSRHPDVECWTVRVARWERFVDEGVRDRLPKLGVDPAVSDKDLVWLSEQAVVAGFGGAVRLVDIHLDPGLRAIVSS